MTPFPPVMQPLHFCWSSTLFLSSNFKLSIWYYHLVGKCLLDFLLKETKAEVDGKIRLTKHQTLVYEMSVCNCVKLSGKTLKY